MDANELKKMAGEAIASIDPARLKPGFSSSEFYVVVGTVLATLATSLTGIPVPPSLSVALVTLAGSYLASRTFLKSKK